MSVNSVNSVNSTAAYTAPAKSNTAKAAENTNTSKDTSSTVKNSHHLPISNWCLSLLDSISYSSRHRFIPEIQYTTQASFCQWLFAYSLISNAVLCGGMLLVEDPSKNMFTFNPTFKSPSFPDGVKNFVSGP